MTFASVSIDVPAQQEKIWLFRVLGNDLPPLQTYGQTYKNLKYILENEPEFPNCQKAFLLNRIVNDEEHSKIMSAITQHNIPSNAIVDRVVDWDSANLDTVRHIENYFERINQARNIAIEHAFKNGAKWVILQNGNTFVPQNTWNDITQLVNERDNGLKNFTYISIPMVRLTQEQNPSWVNKDSTWEQLLSSEKIAKEAQEGTISFAKGSTKRFDDSLTYANKNKFSLLNALCGSIHPENPPKLHSEKFNKCVSITSPVIKLWSYPSKGSESSVEDKDKRYTIRLQSLRAFIERVRKECRRRQALKRLGIKNIKNHGLNGPAHTNPNVTKSNNNSNILQSNDQFLGFHLSHINQKSKIQNAQVLFVAAVVFFIVLFRKSKFLGSDIEPPKFSSISNNRSHSDNSIDNGIDNNIENIIDNSCAVTE